MHGVLDRVEQVRDARVTAASASVTRPISLLLLPPYVSSYYYTCVLVLVYMCGWSGSGCVVRSVEAAACRAERLSGVLGQCRSWCTSISERGRVSCRSAGAVCSAGSPRSRPRGSAQTGQRGFELRGVVKPLAFFWSLRSLRSY